MDGYVSKVITDRAIQESGNVGDLSQILYRASGGITDNDV